jgi:Fur family peroxide stress response transcriptional regulator
MNPTHHKSRLEKLTRGYAEAGLPLTSQRRTLLHVLAGRPDHPTVDQIYAELTLTLPEVSRTTVYRSLEVLTKLNLLKRVEHPGASVRFDPNTEPHHHFLCTACGALSDLPASALSGTGELDCKELSLGQVEEVSVLVRGRCHGCQDVQ